MRKGLLSAAGRGFAVALVSALLVTTFEAPPATAAPASRHVQASKGTGVATDFSGYRYRRYYGGRYYGHRYYGGAGAGLAMMGMMMGTIGALAAQSRYDDYYYGYPGYGYGYPVYGYGYGYPYSGYYGGYGGYYGGVPYYGYRRGFVGRGFYGRHAYYGGIHGRRWHR